MEKVNLGTKVHKLGILRVQVGENSKCRLVLLDPCPRVKHIAYDEERKRRVEVDQDMVIKYGLRPQATFYYLVAKLNTDLNGNIIGDNFTVEYLQLSESLNNDFSDLISECNGKFSTISVTKVKKTANGRDFSYLKPLPSQLDYESIATLKAKIDQIKSNSEFIDQCWKMIDADTSLTKEQYLKLLDVEGGTVQERNSLATHTGVIADSQQKQSFPQQQIDSKTLSDEVSLDNDFSEGFDSFN